MAQPVSRTPHSSGSSWTVVSGCRPSGSWVRRVGGRLVEAGGRPGGSSCFRCSVRVCCRKGMPPACSGCSAAG